MSAFVFLMIRLVPGDPVRTMLGFRATPENVAQVREDALGLDEPLLTQYAQWLGGLIHGDLGQDYVSHTPRGHVARSASAGDDRADAAGDDARGPGRCPARGARRTTAGWARQLDARGS